MPADGKTRSRRAVDATLPDDVRSLARRSPRVARGWSRARAPTPLRRFRVPRPAVTQDSSPALRYPYPRPEPPFLVAIAVARLARRLPDRRPLLEALGFVLAVNLIGSLPGVLSSPDGARFRSLEKPWSYPSEIAFPVVWTALFTSLGIALWPVWRSDASGRRLALGLFAAQMAVNVAWNARNHVPRKSERL